MISLLGILALLALSGAGISMMVGATTMSRRLFRVAAAAVLASVIVPLSYAVGSGAWQRVHLALGDNPVPLSAPLIAAIVVGHVTAAVVLVRRRLRGRDDARRRAAELERARTRERLRLPPRGEEERP